MCALASVFSLCNTCWTLYKPDCSLFLALFVADVGVARRQKLNIKKLDYVMEDMALTLEWNCFYGRKELEIMLLCFHLMGTSGYRGLKQSPTSE